MCGRTLNLLILSSQYIAFPFVEAIRVLETFGLSFAAVAAKTVSI